MPSFATMIIDSRPAAEARLAQFGIVVDQLIEVGQVARAWARDADALMPQNAPGTLAYIYGVQELRRQLVGLDWVPDRSCGIESVVNRSIGMRIGYQNVDRACDRIFAPIPRSAKGAGSESLCGPTLFEYMGIDAGPLTGVRADGIATYYVMVGDDGSVELSQPIIKNGLYEQFNERIFLVGPFDDWGLGIDSDAEPFDDFDVAVTFKDAA